MTFGHFGGSRWSLLPILRISVIVVILGALWPRKGSSILTPNRTQLWTFCGVVFLMFFESSLLLIFCDLGCPEVARRGAFLTVLQTCS